MKGLSYCFFPLLRNAHQILIYTNCVNIPYKHLLLNCRMVYLKLSVCQVPKPKVIDFVKKKESPSKGWLVNIFVFYLS